MKDKVLDIEEKIFEKLHEISVPLGGVFCRIFHQGIIKRGTFEILGYECCWVCDHILKEVGSHEIGETRPFDEVIAEIEASRV